MNTSATIDLVNHKYLLSLPRISTLLSQTENKSLASKEGQFFKGFEITMAKFIINTKIIYLYKKLAAFFLKDLILYKKNFEN